MHAVAKTCGDYSRAQLSSKKREQRKLFGVTRISGMSPTEEPKACRQLKQMPGRHRNRDDKISGITDKRRFPIVSRPFKFQGNPA